MAVIAVLKYMRKREAKLLARRKINFARGNKKPGDEPGFSISYSGPRILFSSFAWLPFKG